MDKSTYARCRRILDALERAVVVALLAVIFAFIMLNVVLRYVFETGIPWTNEIAQQLFVGLTYLAISRVDSEGVHFRVTILEERCAGLRPYLAILRHAVSVLLLPYLAYLATKLAFSAFDISARLPASQLPVAVCYGVVAAGLLLGCVKSAERLLCGIAQVCSARGARP